MIKIRRLLLNTNSECQNNCKGCVTKGARHILFPSYQLTLSRVEELIRYTKDSGYVFENLDLAGFGEPTLWTYFNEGIQLLANSHCFKHIILTTNGLSLQKVDAASWDAISKVIVSTFAIKSSEKQAALNALCQRYPNKFTRRDKSSFIVKIGHQAPIPCLCRCSGPTYAEGRIFSFCADEVFDTFVDAKVNYPHGFSGLSIEIQKDYLKYFLLQKDPHRNFEACRYCWGNRNFAVKRIKHGQETN